MLDAGVDRYLKDRMRRNDKEITDSAVMESIIRKATVCRLAMAKDNQPYVVPMCFGYEDNALYFHSATEGKKLDILKENNRVCFEMDIGQEIVPSDSACQWGMTYYSIIGSGKASFLTARDQKRQALDVIMKHYTGDTYTYTNAAVDRITIIKVKIQHMSGKVSG